MRHEISIGVVAMGFGVFSYKEPKGVSDDEQS